MTRKFLLSGFGALFLLFGGMANAGVIDLFDSCLNVDDAWSNSDGSGTTDAFDCPLGGSQTGLDAEGLGTVSVILGGAGAHYVSLFVDHEIDQSTNTFFNEYGAVNGAAAAGQSWEIDEPDQLFGNIFANFDAQSLDLNNGVPNGDDDDVAMALGWSFTLAAGETATINFVLSRVAPASGFWLQQTDPDSNDSLFFSSVLRITGDVTPVPEPGTLWLLGAGLLGLGLMRRRNLADS